MQDYSRNRLSSKTYGSTPNLLKNTLMNQRTGNNTFTNKYFRDSPNASPDTPLTQLKANSMADGFSLTSSIQGGSLVGGGRLPRRPVSQFDFKNSSQFGGRRPSPDANHREQPPVKEYSIKKG
jgi:hypothetical protein